MLKKRKAGEKVKLVAASAFQGMENRWNYDWSDRYKHIIRNADEVRFLGVKPGKASFVVRDKWMVDHSSRLVGVFTGAPGGTKETIEYAKEKGIEIIKIGDGRW